MRGIEWIRRPIIRIAPKICRLTLRVFNWNLRDIADSESDSPVGSSERQPAFQSSLIGEKFLRRRNVPRGDPLARSRTSKVVEISRL